MLRVFLPLRKNEKTRVSAADVHVVAFDPADPLRHARLCGRTVRPHGPHLSTTGETLFCPRQQRRYTALLKREPSARLCMGERQAPPALPPGRPLTAP